MEEHRSTLSLAPTAWCIAAAALFGASTPLSKPLLASLNPVLLSGLLYAGAAGAVAPWALRVRVSLRGAGPLNRRRLVGAVVFGGIVGPALLLSGLALAPAGSVALWLNLETVATAILARLFFAEHLGRHTWAAIGLIVLASALLSTPTLEGGLSIGLVALACVAWGLDNNFTAVIDGFTAAQVTFAKGVVAALVNGGIGLLVWPRADVPIEPRMVGAALVIGALSYGVSLLLYIRGAQHLFSTAPAWGLVLAWLALGERVEARQFAAATLMGTAIWLWHRERHEHEHTHEAMTHRHWHRHDDGHHDHEHERAVPTGTWHSHEHTHEPVTHTHAHRPDLHHRHSH